MINQILLNLLLISLLLEKTSQSNKITLFYIFPIQYILKKYIFLKYYIEFIHISENLSD